METKDQTTETNNEQAQQQRKHRKYSRLDHSPITVPGTPDTQGTQRFVDFFFKKKYLPLGGLGGLGGLFFHKLFLEKTRNIYRL